MKDNNEEAKWGFGFAKGDKELTSIYANEIELEPGERLKDLLQERHITQQELADSTGLSEGTVSNLINGRNMHQAKASTLIKIAYYLDISVDWLLGLTSRNNMTTDETIKEMAEKTGFSDRAMKALVDSIDYHEHGYDYEYGSVLGYVLDKSYGDKKSFISWLELAKVEAYRCRNGMTNDYSEISWGEDGHIKFSDKAAIDFMIKIAVDKFEALVRKYIKNELSKQPDNDVWEE